MPLTRSTPGMSCYSSAGFFEFELNTLLLIKYTSLNALERPCRNGEYWAEVVAVRIERSEVRTKMTGGQYQSIVWHEQAMLVSSFLYGTRAMVVVEFVGFRKQNKIYTAYDRFYRNGPYGKIPTKKEPITTLGFTSRLPCHIKKNPEYFHFGQVSFSSYIF